MSTPFSSSSPISLSSSSPQSSSTSTPSSMSSSSLSSSSSTTSSLTSTSSSSSSSSPSPSWLNPFSSSPPFLSLPPSPLIPLSWLVASGVSLVFGYVSLRVFRRLRRRLVHGFLLRSYVKKFEENIRFGFDIGGSLTKLVYFEPLATEKNEFQRAIREKVSQFIRDSGSEFCESDKTFQNKQIKGKFYFIKFPTANMETFIQIVSQQQTDNFIDGQQMEREREREYQKEKEELSSPSFSLSSSSSSSLSSASLSSLASSSTSIPSPTSSISSSSPSTISLSSPNSPSFSPTSPSPSFSSSSSSSPSPTPSSSLPSVSVPRRRPIQSQRNSTFYNNSAYHSDDNRPGSPSPFSSISSSSSSSSTAAPLSPRLVPQSPLISPSSTPPRQKSWLSSLSLSSPPSSSSFPSSSSSSPSSSPSSSDSPSPICATGGGAFKFFDLFFHRLGVELDVFDELESLVRGIDFMIHLTTDECYYLSSFLFKMPIVTSPYGRVRYPYLVVNIGSGVSILRVSGPNSFERVGGTSLGGGTFYGLCKALTHCESFEEALQLAENGHSSAIDLLVGDIYGGDYTQMGLSGDSVAASFGKLLSMDEKKLNGIRREDLAKALLVMITNNIGSLANLYAHKVLHVPQIIFCGNFLSNNTIAKRGLAFATDFWSGGNAKALFLKHEGYFGAIGAMLQ